MKRALVVGCGERVWQDVDAAMLLCPDWDAYYVVKLAGCHWQGGRFIWITLHPEYMDDYQKQRAERGLHSDFEIVAPLREEVGRHSWIQKYRRVSYRWKGMNASGSSGLFAVKVALDDGADRVVLAGVPMTTDKHFSRGMKWIDRDSFLLPWRTQGKHFADKTRSLSGGFTEELLGAPTPEWLGL